MGGQFDREKTYGMVCQTYWWHKLYLCVRVEHVKGYKPSPHSAAPLASLPISTRRLESISMNFVFGLPKDSYGNTGIVNFVDRLRKMARLASVLKSIDGEGTV